MTGERNLQTLIAKMEPRLAEAPYAFVTVPATAAPSTAFAVIREEEGLTVIATVDDMQRAGLAIGPAFARITLSVHSDLEAVGLTAAFATALSTKGIPANVVAGFYHDHIFVGWAERHAALAALTALSESAR